MIKKLSENDVPVGTYVAMVFLVTGYDQDCDGSPLARLAQVDRDGGTTGWEETRIGLDPDCEVAVTNAGDLHRLVGENR